MGHLWLSEHHITEGEPRKSPVAISITPVPAGSAILRRYRASIAGLRSTLRPRGTIILLPGYGLGKLSMLPWALLLGRAGYQSILVDLRAQGQSTGEHVTYGALESRDLVQLVAALRKAGLIRGPLGMLGNSMGAATALLAAPHIPDVAAIVAISPYGRATTVLPRYARLTAWYAGLIPSGSWRAAERKAGRLAGVSLAEAAPIAAAPEIRAPVLYVQGGRDRINSAEDAHQLAAHTRGSDLLIYPKLGHLQMTDDYTGLAQPIVDWYNRHLAGDMEPTPPPETGPRPPNAIALSICGARF
jgi:pimeloyl-ACP methyl ester carboxylesterase